jgi:hypothetical protein
MFRNEPATMLGLIEAGPNGIRERGGIISEFTDKCIERFVALPPIRIRIGTWEVAAFNITEFQSACGNILTTKYDEAVGLYTIKGNRVRWSFRSLQHHQPSSLQIAEVLGGGGHQNSAGAEMPLSDFVRLISNAEYMSGRSEVSEYHHIV